VSEQPLLSPDEFAEAMRAAVADPSNAATPGDAPDVIAYDPDVLAAEGGGDDPDACADHLGEDDPDDRPLTGVLGLAATGWRATWLADEFRRAGLVVVEVEGWKNRGVTFPDSPVEEGVSIFHHTASNRNSGPAGGLRIVTYGREGLAGPIANWLTARNGVIYVVAAGVANNAGRGNARAAGLPNTTGNSNTLANEMENDGIGEPYSPAQRTASLIAHAVVHRKMGWSAGRGIGHLEWSTSGKIDPYVKTWGPMSAARTQLARVIEGEIVQEDDMELADRIKLITDPAFGSRSGKDMSVEEWFNYERLDTVKQGAVLARLLVKVDELKAAVNADQVVTLSPDTVNAMVDAVVDGVAGRLDVEIDAAQLAEIKVAVRADISAAISPE